MSEHGILLTALLLLTACGLTFWPKWGYFWRWQHVRRMADRILIEDALKHLYNFEYRRQVVSVESLAGALEIPGNRAVELLVRIEALGLVQSDGDGLHLTPEGRNYALRVIRVHRLWEHHLAEETGTAASEWHSSAEYWEHDITESEADRLAEKMGDPAFDPHGDPIPTASGDIAPGRGQSLTALAEGERVAIVHIEDEPEAVYAQLVADGIHLGMRLEVTEISPERIRLWAEGEEHVLAPVVAANVFVVPLPRDGEMEGPFETLAALASGEKGRVLSISGACRGLERRRLMDLGILPGTVIETEMTSPGGDPTAYRVRGAAIALRKEQARHIRVEKLVEVV